MAANSRLNSLPSEIKLIIFSKLPAELVLDCMRVCKDWRDLVQLHAHTAYFANLHSRCQHDYSMISFISCADNKDLSYAEYYDDSNMNPRKQYCSTKRINLEFMAGDDDEPGDVRLVGSCNGLLCLSVTTCHRRPGRYSYHDCYYHKSIHICNPIIGEIVNLPGTRTNRQKKTVHGFGYHPLTNEYKVVRISPDGDKGQVEVYTLGSRSGWRSLKEISYHVRPNISAGSVCVNGALHWLQKGSEDIVAFDLADEEFHLLQSPPGFISGRELGVFKGCLVLFNDSGLTNNHSCDLWFLNKDSSWRKVHTVSLGWRDFGLFALSEGGQLLIISLSSGRVFRYNLLESQVSDDIWEFDEEEKSWAVPIQHRSTFLSLKAIGEENVGTITAEGELEFPSTGERKSGAVKTAPPPTTSTSETSSEDIVAFDLADEEFHLLQSPPGFIAGRQLDLPPAPTSTSETQLGSCWMMFFLPLVFCFLFFLPFF